jgi:hypothetical protein
MAEQSAYSPCIVPRVVRDMDDEDWHHRHRALEAAAPVPAMADLAEQSLYKQKRAAGKVSLPPKGRLLVEYLVHGADTPQSREMGLPTDRPLSLGEACKLLRLRKRNARQLLATPEAERLMVAAIASLRNGSKGRAMAKIIELVERPVVSAADGSLALDAARTVLGEDAKGITVNIGAGAGSTFNVRPGYVIREPRSKEPPTIEGTIAERLPTNQPRQAPAEAALPDPLETFKRRIGS